MFMIFLVFLFGLSAVFFRMVKADTAVSNFGFLAFHENRAVPVLNYHKVEDLHHALSVSAQEFEEQMKYLRQKGYTSITPEQLVNYLQAGTPLPHRPILITFDDGYADNFSNAYPIMQKYGFTATIFLATGFVNHDARFMRWWQIREMQANGFIFGSHGVGHHSLDTMSKAQVMRELRLSRAEIARQLGQIPYYFAYPSGVYNQHIEDMVRTAGYKAAFSVKYGRANANSDFYALERIPVFKGDMTFQSFYVRLQFAPLLERLGIMKQ
jgi:peptidoglycan/xylan/chitin deacetylase (PgdA/CDA1 family)